MPSSAASRGGLRSLRRDLRELLQIETQAYAEIFDASSGVEECLEEFIAGTQAVLVVLDRLCGSTPGDGDGEDGRGGSAEPSESGGPLVELRSELRRLFRLAESQLFGPARARLTRLG